MRRYGNVDQANGNHRDKRLGGQVGSPSIPTFVSHSIAMAAPPRLLPGRFKIHPHGASGQLKLQQHNARPATRSNSSFKEAEGDGSVVTLVRLRDHAPYQRLCEVIWENPDELSMLVNCCYHDEGQVYTLSLHDLFRSEEVV